MSNNRANIGHVAGVSFFDRNLSWGTDTDREGENRTHTTVVEKVEGYKSGEFYKRELPCIKALLEEHNLTPDCIIVDGFVKILWEQYMKNMRLFVERALNHCLLQAKE